MSERKILALDIGDARIGAALSAGAMAVPYEIIGRKDGREIEEIAQIAVKERITDVVAGVPYELDGTIGSQTRKTLNFLKKLEGHFRVGANLKEIRFHEWDERLSTVEAGRALIGSKLKNKKRREALDKIAATLILDGFLASGR